MNTSRRQIVLSLVAWPMALAACASPGDRREPAPGIGLVVFYQLGPGAKEKEGVNAVSETGLRLFGPAVLTSRNGGVSTYGGAAIPRWVDVTWRKDMTAMLPGKQGRYDTGVVIGNHRVQVLDRIPKEVLDYARAGPGRALKLKFRLHDDRVLFAWEVEEPSANNQVYVSKMRGGDFQEAKMFNGKVIDPGWER